MAKLTDNTGVDVVVDFIGASYLEKNITSLARDGRMVLLGLMGGTKTREGFDMSGILYKRLRIEGASSDTVRSAFIAARAHTAANFGQAPRSARGRWSTRPTCCRTFPRRPSTRSLRAARVKMASTWSSTRCVKQSC